MNRLSFQEAYHGHYVSLPRPPAKPQSMLPFDLLLLHDYLVLSPKWTPHWKAESDFLLFQSLNLAQQKTWLAQPKQETVLRMIESRQRGQTISSCFCLFLHSWNDRSTTRYSSRCKRDYEMKGIMWSDTKYSCEFSCVCLFFFVHVIRIARDSTKKHFCSRKKSMHQSSALQSDDIFYANDEGR